MTDAKTLLERLREHDAAAESLVDQSAALHRRVAAMREAGAVLPEQVGPGRTLRWARRGAGGWGRRLIYPGPEGWAGVRASCAMGGTAAVSAAPACVCKGLICLSVQYQEDAPDVKDMSKYKPHILLSQENTQIRDLQQENRG